MKIQICLHLDLKISPVKNLLFFVTIKKHFLNLFIVKYVEKYIVDAENPDNITAFRAIDKGVELDNFKLGSATTTTTEDNKKISFAGNTAVFDNKLNQFNLQIIKIDLKQAAVTPATPVTIKAETNNCEINPPTMKNIFKKTSCTNGIIEKLKIELDAGNNNFEISKFTGICIFYYLKKF